MSSRLPGPRKFSACGAASLALVLFAACGDDTAALEVAPAHDAAARDAAAGDTAAALDAAAALHDGAMPAASADAGDAAPVDPETALREHGEYIVRHVAGCNECHTPRLESGAFDESKLLSGVEDLVDFDPDDATRGAVHSRNLTPDEETGLGGWTDEQIDQAFRHGVDDEDEVLHWMMPYWIFHHMDDEDARAVIAYLRSLPAVRHEVPENQPGALGEQPPAQPYELPSDRIPAIVGLDPSDADYASAERGRYLASSVAPCMLCHTPAVEGDLSVPVDASRIFAGRRQMIPVKLGTPVEDDPPRIDSWNLTPHDNGIAAWSAADVSSALRQGVGRDGLPVCDPMPSYMGGSFTGMSERDALDLGNYFTHIAPENSGPVERCCSVCHAPPDTDAGVP